MFRSWVRLLPYFLVVRKAKRDLERIRISPDFDWYSAEPFPGEVVSWKETK